MSFDPYLTRFQWAVLEVAFWNEMATNAPTPELADEYVKRFRRAIDAL